MDIHIPTDIYMVDLHSQYLRIKEEIDIAIQEVIDSSMFIRGPVLSAFESELSAELGGVGVLGVANGTDALQIALMALGVGPGDEVITPSFTFVATAEAVGLLGATPVFADIDPHTFSIDAEQIQALITGETKAIVPVHLFGQCADMSAIMDIAESHGIPVIEDAAQAVGARFEGRTAGSMGDFGTLSFFPTKNLACFGDGGAVVSHDPDLLDRARLIANHGSMKKYHNEIIGINSRLDAMQAAILRVKLKHLQEYSDARRLAADRYDELFSDVSEITCPVRDERSTHVFHQYTIRVIGGDSKRRDALQQFLKQREVPSFVYYPVPLHLLPIYKDDPTSCRTGTMDETSRATNEVLSLPMHTELTHAQQVKVVDTCRAFFNE